ncbi:MAG: ABC transporter transmembrane domain-containing protein [Marinilabiliales bacterium]|nr:ABC transporter transmembrane domain-containing protein [Marinilabiliales bacterium]
MGIRRAVFWFGIRQGVWFASTEKDLAGIWKSKKCLGLVPDSSFRYMSEEKIHRFRWVFDSIKPEKDLLLSSLAIGILISVLGLVMAVFTQKLLDQILPFGEKGFLIISSVLVFVLLIARVILSAIRQLFLLTQGKLFNIRVVDGFYKSLMLLPKDFFDTRKTGDFVARLNDTIRIQRVIAEIVGTYLIDILIIIVTITMLFYYSSIAAVISLICLPAFYMLVIRWNRKLLAAQHSVMSGYALSESNFINTLRGIIEIKSMNWHSEFSERNRVVYSDFQGRSLFTWPDKG